MIAYRTIALAIAASAAATTGFAADLPSRKMEPAPAEVSMPAVDGVNAKLEVFGGLGQRLSQDPSAPFFTRNQWRPVAGVQGSVAIPLGHAFGLQIDGSAASAGGAFVGSLGGHAFWRDPSKGLLGVYGSGSYVGRGGGVVIGRVGPEAEIYLGRVTLQGVGGVEFGSQKSATFGFPLFTPAATFLTLNPRSVKTRFFDIASIAFYPIDDLKLSIGQRYVSGRLAATAGFEYLVTHGPTAVSVYAEGRLGQRGASAALGGLKVYFGQKDKSLIRRHREDDPVVYQFGSGAAPAGGGSPAGGGVIPVDNSCQNTGNFARTVRKCFINET